MSNDGGDNVQLAVVHAEPQFMSTEPADAARLSKLLFEAREQIDMWADVVEQRSGRTSTYQRDLLAKIDAYRAERGWSPNGFGGEL